MLCVRCRAALPAGSHFCSFCGQAQPLQTQPLADPPPSAAHPSSAPSFFQEVSDAIRAVLTYPRTRQLSTPQAQIGFSALAGMGIILCVLCSLCSMAANFHPSVGNPLAFGGVRHVGDTITVDGVSCTLVSVQPSTTTDGIPNVVTVEIKLVNNSSSEVQYNALDFHAVTGTGQVVDFAADLLGSGGLVPGGTVDGGLDFLLTANDHSAKLLWQPGLDDVSGDTSNEWSLGL